MVGGFLRPSIKAIEALHPDVIFLSSLHKDVRRYFSGKAILVQIEPRSLKDVYWAIDILGKIFEREKEAQEVINRIRKDIDLISKKVEKIPYNRRKRVMRIMGRRSLMAPGDDSFQNSFIKLAGGIPPKWGKKGGVVSLTAKEFIDFNPQIIYGCGGDRELYQNLIKNKAFREVEAIKKRRIYFFPCALTCRASVHTGYFISWLSSLIYPEEFSSKKNQLIKDETFKIRYLSIPIPYIKTAKIEYSYISDFVHKTLLIEFKRPCSVINTLEGMRPGISTIGNHFFPPPCWGLKYTHNLTALRKRVYGVLGKSFESTSLLFTGADMDSLSISHETFRDMNVFALVTAGVRSNAMRMSQDIGTYYEPGTINIIILTNMELSPRAMSRAIITATEAKSAALEDMDIRSSYTPLLNRATGTGTDNVIIVQGQGTHIDATGGHTRMGELIAKAVYKAVIKAIRNQNGIVIKRNIFQRLRDRRISLYELVANMSTPQSIDRSRFLALTEEILIKPEYDSFIKTAFSVSDAYEKGLIQEISSFLLYCNKIAERIAGHPINHKLHMVKTDKLPFVVREALNALFNGIYYKIKNQ